MEFRIGQPVINKCNDICPEEITVLLAILHYRVDKG
jgi:hypothetical protein